MRDVLTTMQRNKADNKSSKNNHRNSHQHLTQAEVYFEINYLKIKICKET